MGEAATNRRQGRRWRFASALLDEGNWTLLVEDRRVAIESKPMELLHELLLRAGQVVTKDELLGAIWPGVSVVEASLPTAIAKLRRALGDDKGSGGIIETVPRIGYRLAVPVALEDDSSAQPGPADLVQSPFALSPSAHKPGWPIVAGGLALTLAIGAVTTLTLRTPTSATKQQPVSRMEVIDALRKLDSVRLRDLLARGWKADAPLDWASDGSIGIALEICEWNPQHDREQLMQVVRLLLDNGARVDRRNVFGDTAYSIAAAKRYCGPDHPATRLLHAICYNGTDAPGDKCLARYAQGQGVGHSPTPQN